MIELRDKSASLSFFGSYLCDRDLNKEVHTPQSFRLQTILPRLKSMISGGFISLQVLLPSVGVFQQSAQ
jgi:hypothetical protein